MNNAVAASHLDARMAKIAALNDQVAGELAALRKIGAELARVKARLEFLESQASLRLPRLN